MIGLLALAALCGCATAAKPAAENGDYVRESEVASQEDTSQNEPLKVIDAHLHTDFNGQPEETSKIMQTREQLEREFAEAGVVGAISHAPAEGGPLGDTTGLNVVHCYGVQAKVNVQKLEHALKSRKYRCVKVYLGYEHQFAYDKGYAPVYRLARKYDVPVVFHTGDTYSSKGKLKYADPMTIDEVAVDHPDVTFVIAHCGNPWIQTAAEVAYKNPNVYLECSAILIGDLDESGEETVQEHMVKPIKWVFDYVEDPKKLMFGTDWPLVGIKDYLEAYKKAIPPEHWRAVFHDNAKRVFFKEMPIPSAPVARAPASRE